MREAKNKAFALAQKQAQVGDGGVAEQAELRKRSEHKQNEVACRETLDEQMACQARKAYEHRVQEAYEGAEIKMRATKQLCDYLESQRQNKELMKTEYEQAMQQVADKRRAE